MSTARIRIRHGMCTFAAALLAAMVLVACQRPKPANDWQALLFDRDYAALEARLAALQQGYEQGSVTDLQLRSAWRAFDHMPARSGDTLDDWLERRPTSYYARLARAYHRRSLAWDARGGGTSGHVGRQRWTGIKEQLRLSGEDAQASLALTARPVLSVYLLFDAAGMPCDRKALDEYFALGRAYAPHSALLYNRRMLFLKPRWCGSGEQMEALLRQAADAGLPAAALQQMQAIVDDDAGQSLMELGHVDEAAVRLRRAAEVGDRAGPQFVRESLYGVRAYACKLQSLSAWCREDGEPGSEPKAASGAS